MHFGIELLKWFLGIDQYLIGLHSPRVADKAKPDLAYTADRLARCFDVQCDKTKRSGGQRLEMSKSVQHVHHSLHYVCETILPRAAMQLVRCNL